VVAEIKENGVKKEEGTWWWSWYRNRM